MHELAVTILNVDDVLSLVPAVRYCFFFSSLCRAEYNLHVLFSILFTYLPHVILIYFMFGLHSFPVVSWCVCFLSERVCMVPFLIGLL